MVLLLLLFFVAPPDGFHVKYWIFTFPFSNNELYFCYYELFITFTDDIIHVYRTRLYRWFPLVVPNRTEPYLGVSVWPDLHNLEPVGRFECVLVRRVRVYLDVPVNDGTQGTHYTPLGIPLVLYFASVPVA